MFVYRMLLCVLSCFIFATIGTGADDPPNTRPNILFVVADDLNCKIGSYGDPVAITPNLDRLAARGLTFENAFCQQTVCNPSRASFLTGLHPDTIGVDDLRKYFRDTAPNGKKLVTLPQHFKQQGYFCQNIGKLFHNMGDTQDRQSWSIDEVLHKGTHAADTIFSNQPLGKEKPTFKAPVTEALDVPDTVYRDGQIANLAASMIRDHDSDQPFFLAVGFWRPHLPFVAPKKYWDLYEPVKIPLPDPLTKTVGIPEIAFHDSREIKGYGRVPKNRAFNENEVRHYRHGFYASISFLDAQLGEILDALDKSSHAENTIVVFTSDHGFHIGEFALWGKTSNFELDARVPLIIASPKDKLGHGKKTKAMAELVDLYPTLADLANSLDATPDNLEGASLKPLLNAPTRRVKDAAFTQTQQPFYGPYKGRKAIGYSVQTERYRYTQWRSIENHSLIETELYDRNQEHETHNLADNTRFDSVVEKLSRHLRERFRMISKTN